MVNIYMFDLIVRKTQLFETFIFVVDYIIDLQLVNLGIVDKLNKLWLIYNRLVEVKIVAMPIFFDYY